MKNIILLTTVTLLFMSAHYTTAEARDCSDPKGFHAKAMCKLMGESSSKPAKEKGDSFWSKLKIGGGKPVDVNN